MRFRLMVCIMACGLLAGVAWGQTKLDLTHGHDLLEACTKPTEGEPVNAHRLSYFYCLGYITGVSDALQVAGQIVMPSGVSRDQGRQVVFKYLQDHPELLHQTSIELVTNALEGAWGTHKKE